MIFVEISEEFLTQVRAALLERAAQVTLQQQATAPTADLSIILTGDEPLQQLNRQYLEIDAPTDVLSFPADYTDPDSGRPYLGDVLISYPRAEAQANAAGHSLEAELQLLVVHGVLHLLGHDHLEADEKNRMWAAQNEILTASEVSLAQLPE